MTTRQMFDVSGEDGLMSRSLLLIGMLVLTSCSKPSDSLYEYQAACGRDARDWAEKKWRQPGPGSLPDFANHYNTKLARCFVFWTNALGGKPGSATSELVDVNENMTVGSYFQAGDSDKPTRCEVEDKQCYSSKQWSALVSPYIHD